MCDVTVTELCELKRPLYVCMCACDSRCTVLATPKASARGEWDGPWHTHPLLTVEWPQLAHYHRIYRSLQRHCR